MRAVDVGEAQEHFHDLIARVEQGEEVLLLRDGVGVARLVPCSSPKRVRRAGTLEGQIWIADDFDAVPPEFDAPGE